MRHLDIRLKLVIILVVSVLVFWAGSLYLSLTLLGAILIIWFLSGLGARELKPIGKIKWFILAIIFFHSYFSFERDFLVFTFFKWAFMISKEGLQQGLLMGSNVLVMLLFTALVRKTSKPEDVIKGLQSLGMSVDQATVLDATMELAEMKQGQKKEKGQQVPKKGEGKEKRKLWGIIKANIRARNS